MKLVILLTMLISSTCFAADQEGIRQAVKKNHKDVSACYKELLERTPAAEGKIVLAWEINDQGKVNKVSVNEKSTTLKDSKLQNCMMEKLKSWTFPAAEKGKTTDVNYPFTFSPKKTK